MSEEAKRRFPDWYQRTQELRYLTPERLKEMRSEAEECDAHNSRAFQALMQAYRSFEQAIRDFGGRVEKVRRSGCYYIAVPVAPWSSCLRAVEDLERRWAEDQKKKEQEQAAKKRQAEQDKERRKADIELAGLILRYSAPEDTDWDGMLELLRSKDQYLDLAIAGQETRGDWSDGFYRVSEALQRFKLKDERDKEIAADLLGCMGSEDGRVFRDTQWNYGELYALVSDQQLAKDAQLCLSRVDR